MRPLLPAGLLALFAGWVGSFYYGASASAVLVAHALLLALAAWAWRGWDPLRLGRGARALPALLWTLMLLAQRASPVPRAGWVAVALLPALLVLPAALARSLAERSERRLALLAIVGVGGAIAAVALVAMAWQRSQRAAQPLGQALILAEVLAPLLPLCVVAVELPAARAQRGERWLAVLATVLVIGALLATRSFAATAGATLGLFLALPRGHRRWALPLLLLGVALLTPRLLRVWRGEDSSVLARLAYAEAGLQGVESRPLLGWGPGSTAWTLSPLVHPIPGENQPGEVISDLHALPLQLAYELGPAAMLVAAALVLAFLRARRRERAGAEDPEAEAIARGGLAGVVAGVTTLLPGPTLGTLAPWLALAVAAGVALGVGGAGAGETALGSPATAHGSWRLAARAGWLYAAVALLLLLPLDAAHVCYDLARRAPPLRAHELLLLASQLDPELPLYHARLGWQAPTAAARQRELERAATGAPGVAALQLAAGWAGAVANDRGADRWLRRACAGDPLAGMAPFLLAMREPSPLLAARLGGRALLTDPPLLAALDWEARPELRQAALREAKTWPGVDAGFREALAREGESMTADGPFATLRVTTDEVPATAMSIYAFRRLPWPTTLASVVVRTEASRLMKLMPASMLRTSARSAFPSDCAAAPPPGVP